MQESEEVPLWDGFTHRLAKAVDFAFGYYHRKLSRVFTIDGHSYKVCCDCGATFNYSLETVSIRHRRRWLWALHRLRLRRQRFLRRAANAL